jgi:serine/threonine-protein kinase
VEGIQACRSELNAVGGGTSRVATGPKTLFVVESSQKLQDVFREKFKAVGFRVLLSIDPAQAVKRYLQQGYHAIIVDARPPEVGREGITAYNDVLRAADQSGMEVAAILLLNEDQSVWKSLAREHARGAVLVEPPNISMKQLLRTLDELTAAKK